MKVAFAIVQVALTAAGWVDANHGPKQMKLNNDREGPRAGTMHRSARSTHWRRR
jgi:hypothetical protein